jgi:predicted nucleic acid-binding protein
LAALRSFPDSGVLIDAARGKPPYGIVALRFLANANQQRIFLTSPFVWLETVPKAQYMGQADELELYRDFFEDPAVQWCREWDRLEEVARAEAILHGLGALDALHLAAAHLLGAEEFVTAERPGKAIYLTQLVRVGFLYAGVV